MAKKTAKKNVAKSKSGKRRLKEAPVGRTFRVGGLVETNSVKRDNDGLTVRFTVTDTAQSIPVVYKGILPDLFKEGKGCVAQGRVGADDEPELAARNFQAGSLFHTERHHTQGLQRAGSAGNRQGSRDGLIDGHWPRAFSHKLLFIRRSHERDHLVKATPLR